MRAGDLSKRISILVRESRQDSVGQPIDDWSVYMTTWGDVRYRTGLQYLSADIINSGIRCSVRIRKGLKSALIKSGMRARIEGKLFDVVDALPQDRASIDLICEIVRT